MESPVELSPDLETARGTSVRCTNVGKVFDSGVEALKGIDLDCPPAQCVVLLGPSGCGKTTLLRSIAGLESLSDGRIEIGGQDVTAVEPQHRGVAMVFQNYGLYPDKTAYANIEFPLLMAKAPRREREERVRTTARLLRIEDLLNRRPAQLSGGQRQRVGIGRALVRNPRVLLMDEPLSSLDAELRAEMRVEIRLLQRRLGTTTIYVTHDQAEALSLADQLVVMQAGQIEQVGPPEAVFNRPATCFVAGFLGRMNLIPAESLRREGCRAPAGAATIGVRPEDLVLGADDFGDGLALNGPTAVAELVGRERIVHFTVGQQTLRLRCSADLPVPSMVCAWAPRSALHFFGADGHRL